MLGIAAPPNLGIVSSRERVGPWLERLRRGGMLGVDTETTGLKWLHHRVGGLCLAAWDTTVYFTGDALGAAVLWLSDQVDTKRPLVMHNAKFDLHMLRGTFGLRVPYPVEDTRLLSFLHNNLLSHHLKDLAKELDPSARDPETEMLASTRANGGRSKGDMLLADPELVGRYGALDPWYTLQLLPIWQERVRNVPQESFAIQSMWDLYENEKWLVMALVDMEARGIRVQPQFFIDWEKALQKDIIDCTAKLRELGGVDESFNWGSTPQLQDLIYKKLKVPIKRRTGKGKPSTDEVSLLKMDHPIAVELLRYRDLVKQHSTYAQGLLNAVVDSRIHAYFKPTGARTGRLSCEDPNLQQIPRESGARRGFIPDEGKRLYFADYSQVEMRFAAHIANDPMLVNGFRNDPHFDTHAATAMLMWGMRSINPEKNKIHKRRRKFAKIMNFGMLFGAGRDQVTNQLTSMLSWEEAEHSLKEFDVHLPPGSTPFRPLAETLMRIYFQRFPSVKNARYSKANAAEETGYTTNLFGRRRYFDEGTWYKAFNTEIQGAAADQAKRGLVKLYRECELHGEIELLMQIHDEAVYQSGDDPRIHRKVLSLLNEANLFRIPIVAEIEYSDTTWQDKKPWRDNADRV